MSEEEKMTEQKETGDGTKSETEVETDEPGPRYTKDDLPPAGAGILTPSFLVEIRANSTRRGVLLVVAAVIGVGLAWFHWAGLFVAGALVGLVSETVPRAVVAGVIVGVLVLVFQIGISPVMGAGEFVALSPPSYVAVAAGLLMPIWGSLIRGVI